MVKVELELSTKEYTELIHAIHEQIIKYKSVVDDMKKDKQKCDNNYFFKEIVQYDNNYLVKEIAKYEEYLSMLNSIYERLIHS